MTRYRRRPLEIEAWCWQGQPRSEWPRWLEPVVQLADGSLAVGGIREPVHRGEYLVREGKHVMRLPKAVFDATYEPVE